jgi:hypothetical protein
MRYPKNKKEINQIYDWQITQGRYQSITHQELFNLTHNFTIDDWQRIRTEKYWNIINQMQDEIEYNEFGFYKIKKAIDCRSEYTLKCVRYYLKHIKKEIPS